MNKSEFLTALEKGLGEVSPDERVAAMQYYTEYLDEAGPEREAEVLEELGSPQKVAADIIAASGAMTTTGWTPPPRPELDAAKAKLDIGPAPTPGFDEPEELAGNLPATVPQPAQQQAADAKGYNEKLNRVAKVILLVLVIILAVSLFSGLGGVLVGVITALVFLFLCPLILGAALTVGGVVIIVSGAMLIPYTLGSGLIMLGVGVMLFGLGVMCFYAGTRLLGKTLPKVVGWCVNICRTLFQKLRGLIQSN